MSTLIETTCGEAPLGLENFEIKNDPNFVFENDPNFETVTLYDTEENIINVNSWVECSQYVKGGWSNSSSKNFEGDQFLAISLSFCLLIYLIYKKLWKK